MKPNWIGPKATINTQAKTEMELSLIAWEEPIILDCLEPIRYQLPVCRKGFLRSPSPSSLKLIFSECKFKLKTNYSWSWFIGVEILLRRTVLEWMREKVKQWWWKCRFFWINVLNVDAAYNKISKWLQQTNFSAEKKMTVDLILLNRISL